MAKKKKWYSTKRATIVTEIDGMQACVYHQTAVVKWDGERVILDSGGWRPDPDGNPTRRDPGRTTMDRMNQCAREYGLGYSVWQEKYRWFVTLPKPLPASCEEEEQLRLLAATDLGDDVIQNQPGQVIPFEDVTTDG